MLLTLCPHIGFDSLTCRLFKSLQVTKPSLPAREIYA